MVLEEEIVAKGTTPDPENDSELTSPIYRGTQANQPGLDVPYETIGKVQDIETGINQFDLLNRIVKGEFTIIQMGNILVISLVVVSAILYLQDNGEGRLEEYDGFVQLFLKLRYFGLIVLYAFAVLLILRIANWVWKKITKKIAEQKKDKKSIDVK